MGHLLYHLRMLDTCTAMRLGGLQSWWLLSGKLKGGCFRVHRLGSAGGHAARQSDVHELYERPEYKPPGSDHDAPSERKRQCLGRAWRP